jgi:hypothetical protein
MVFFTWQNFSSQISLNRNNLIGKAQLFVYLFRALKKDMGDFVVYNYAWTWALVSIDSSFCYMYSTVYE